MCYELFINELFIIEKDEKYKSVIHQHDVWHGGKNITKKINAVSISLHAFICCSFLLSLTPQLVLVNVRTFYV